jgi:hypothetical protein
MQNDGRRVKARSWAAFLRLWFVLLFSYFAIKFIFNLAVMGWIDLRPVAFKELLILPLGQSVMVWLITRRRRQPNREQLVASPSASDGTPTG